MSKRRRSAASIDSKDDDDNTMIGPPLISPTSLKRRKRSSTDQGETIQDLYDAVRNYKNNEGRLLCEAFIRAPKRRTLPEYYEVVTNPMDMLKIQQRIKMDEYNSVDQMATDLELMVKNAQAYFKRNAQENKDATELWDIFCEAKKIRSKETSHPGNSQNREVTGKEPHTSNFVMSEISPKIKIAESPKSPIVLLRRQECSWDAKLAAPEESSESSESETEEKKTVKASTDDSRDTFKIGDYTLEDPSNPMELLFTAVMAHRDPTKRIVSTLFRKLPPKLQFPDYYDVIPDPIDLKDIAKKIKTSKYPSLDDLEKDLLLMVNNAKVFNEPGSQVYKDSYTIRRLILARKNDIEKRIARGPLPSRSSNAPPSGLSALNDVLAIPSDDEEEEDGEEEDGEEEEGEVEEGEVEEGEVEEGEVEEDDDEAEDEEEVEGDVKNDDEEVVGDEEVEYDENQKDKEGPEEDEEVGSAMEYEDADESGNESMLSDTTDSLHLLFSTVINYKNAAGQVISEPFMRLPSRRTYPDYYQEIINPVALCKIRTKVKTSKYDSVQELINDLDLVFNNAKQYNMPNSRLYKDADRLQRVMVAKCKELDTFKKDFDSEDEASRRMKKAKLDDLRTNMMTLYGSLADYKDDSDRSLITMFMEKPSKKEYPDYYQVITDPVDMKTIEVNILTDKYPSEDALLFDFDTMFSNARHYNEEGSMVYEDANHLEKILKKKCNDLSIAVPDFQVAKGLRKSPSKKSVKVLSPLAQKLQDLYSTIKDYKDSTGRELATPFVRLPSKNEYPEYYQVIKKPIDMQRIQQRIISKQYEQLDDMVNDFLLLFDNACKFNEPDSLIYKDALTLQRLLLQTRTELSGDETSGVPDVQGIIREILTSLLVSAANHQDEEGRCFSDSLAEVTVEKLEKDSEPETPQNAQRKPIDLDMVRRYLDKGCYKRLDIFQDHIFEVFERARLLSRTDSQIYEDAVELQKFFIKIRDEICKNGEILLSPALSYTNRHMQNDVDEQKQEKLPKEKEDAEKKEEDGKNNQTQHPGGGEENKDEDVSDGLMINGKTYRIGDFVYVEPSEKQLKPHIVCIEKLWRDVDGEGWLHGNWFLRPNETFHLATRKFLEKEVFKSDYFNKVKVSLHVIGHCFVMFVKDYFKMKPEGFTNEDVFVCESRYSAKAKAFKKIKLWSIPQNNHKINTREEPLSKVRVASVFAGAQLPNELLGNQSGENFTKFEKDREDIELEVADQEKGTNIYYEQLNYQGRCYKLGDALYITTPLGKRRPLITRMDKIWNDTINKEYFFSGPNFLKPSEVVHPPTRMFYKNEVFLSSSEDDVFAFKTILRKCAVMAFKDYLISRPTEFNECDVYICESQYKDQEQQMRKLKALKKYSVSNKVIDDEIYFFKKPITPLKEPSPLLQPELEDEDAEGGTTAEEAEDAERVEPNSGASASKEPKKARSASGFILFASEIRAQVKDGNPKKNFGEISRLCGLEWHKLSAEDKIRYEERAAILGESKPPRIPRKGSESPSAQIPPPPGMYTVHECLWGNCDYQYETTEDLVHHLLETSGHLQGGDTQFPCQWKGCSRFKRNQPFPVFSRLVRHCKEVHIKNAYKHVYPHQQSRNYFPRFPLQPGGAIMGIVGPPTPVGMATDQLSQNMPRFQGNHNMGMPDMGMQMPGPYQHVMTYQQQPYQQPGASMNQAHMQQSQYMQQSPHMQQHMQHHMQQGPMSGPQQHLQGMHGGMMHPHVSSPPPPPPMFVTPPAKTQRLLHSEAYIRYIEGLNSNSDSISDWRRSLSAKQEQSNLTDEQKSHLPGHWFANGPGRDGDVVKALWKLRDLMMQDTLRITKNHDLFDTEPEAANIPELASISTEQEA